jgi:flagellin
VGFQQGFRINTNTASLDTYRAYSKSQAGLEQNIERLSSGLRINSAKDDAAGLAISERMNNKIRGMQQANRNVQQGVNLLQTAEGGMNEIGNILGRMRELAVQSASDTVNDDDRSSIDLEFDQLKSEITRIASATEYNNTTLINGDRAKGLNTDTANGGAANGGTAIDVGEIASAADVQISSVTTNGTYTFVDLLLDDGKSLGIKNSDGDLLQTVTKASGFAAGDEVNFDEVGIVIKLDSVAAGGTDYATGNLHELSLIVGSGNAVTVQIGANNTPAEDRIEFNLGSLSVVGLGIDTSDLDAVGGGQAQKAIDMLDRAIAKVNDERSNVGSLQNRLEFTSSNLMNSIQNNSASMSTIRDADFAAEAADLARNQILTQSGTAMLAQANGLSQNVLSLIR